VGRLSIVWGNENVSLRINWAHSFAHRRTSVYLQIARYLINLSSGRTTDNKPHPFVIECDKSFTRSDALTKHMRVVHSIEPATPHSRPPIAGTSTIHPPSASSAGKKRKRGAKVEEESDMDEDLPPGALESGGDDDGLDDMGGAGTEDDVWNPSVAATVGGKGARRRPQRRSRGGNATTTAVKTEDIGLGAGSEGEWSDDDASDYEALLNDIDPNTRFINGTECSLAKARYLIIKAKYRFVVSITFMLLDHALNRASDMLSASTSDFLKF